MKKNLAYFLSIFAFSTFAACGGGSSEPDVEDPPDDTPEEVDTTAPSVLSTTPATGAVGQRADVEVSITFSEAMDKPSVEAALDTSELGDVTLSWNAAADTLTISPELALEYAGGIGADPTSVTANSYAVSVGAAARDLAGNQLGAETEVVFDTYKEMAITLPPYDAMTRSMTPSEVLYELSDPLVVGDNSDDQGIRTGITFEIDELPDSAVEIVSATLATRQLPGEASGTPYADLGDSVLLDHVSFNELDSENNINGAFNSSQLAMASHAGFCVEGQVVIEFDVTDDVDSDLEYRDDRGDLSQYLLSFDLANDEDGNQDRAVISRELLELQVTYLAP